MKKTTLSKPEVSRTAWKIVWAVDAFEKESETKAHVISVLKDISKKRPADIEPVFILNPEELDLTLNFASPWMKYYKPAAEKSLRSILSQVELPSLLKPKVIVTRKPTLTHAAKALVAYAKASGANMIVIGTHARKGLPRLLLGSFAETVLLHSHKIPLVVVGPSAQAGNLNHILFATDFGENSAKLFQRIIQLAKNLDSRLTIFHVHPHPIEPVFQSGVYLLGGGWTALPRHISRSEELSARIAEDWAKAARSEGVKASPLTYDSMVTGVTESILAEAENEEVNLIAMASESGPIASAWMGSITRDVLRNAHCPVWVMRN